jgi:uncharacterized protein
MLLAAAACFAGASIQSATGFGFALVLSPALFAVLDPYEAVSGLLLLGLALNLLVLFGGGRPGPVRWRPLVPMLAAAVPGLVAGLWLLSVLSKPTLQVTVGLLVIAATAFQARRRPPPTGSPEAGRAAPALAAGLASGTLTTATSLSGPPLVLWLDAQGARPAEVRASLAAAFLALNLAGALVLLAAGDLASPAGPGVLAALLGLTAAGYLTGAWLFRRLDARRFRTIVLAVVALTGAASVAAGLAG